MSVHFEIADTTSALLQEINCPVFKRRDVAQTYALALKSPCSTDWEKVNAAIINRWSRAALIWIKQQARSGKCFKEK